MPSPRLLLTGAAGFLGHAIARAFGRAGWAVHGLDAAPPVQAPRELSGYHQVRLPGPELAATIARIAPEGCVHAAGRASVALSLEQPERDFHDGVFVTFELLNALRLHAPACRTVLLSSAAVYGNPASLPIQETAATAPLSPYGFHKLQVELLGEEFASVYMLPVASARIFSAYGRGLRRQVVWDICAKALRDGSLNLRGAGDETRDFIHATDVAGALLSILTAAPLQGERYNVASGEETSIAGLAERLLRHLGLPGPAQFGEPGHPGDPKYWSADITRLRALGFAPLIGLEEGLCEVAVWARHELGVLA